MIRWFAVLLAMLATPSVTWACTGCVSSAFGDRTFGWPYLSLIIAPFLVGSGIAGVLAYYYRDRRGTVPTRSSTSPAVRRDPRRLDKETT